MCTTKYFLWYDCLMEQWPISKHFWFRGRSDTNENVTSALQLYSKCVCLGKKIFRIILPTLKNEQAEVLIRDIIFWLASYSSDFFSPQQRKKKKDYYNEIIKIKSLEISRSPWFECWLTNMTVFLPQFCRSQPNTFPTWPCFPQWSSPSCLPCCSCGTSGREDPLPPGLPTAQCGYGFEWCTGSMIWLSTFPVVKFWPTLMNVCFYMTT